MDNSMTIRRLESNDFPGFSALITRFFDYAGNEPPTADQIRTLFDRALSPEHNIDFVTAIADGELVGIISVTIGESSYKFSPFAWCDDFYIDPHHRGSGVGTRLLQAVTEMATEKGCSNILVAVGRDDQDAQGFYQARGFRDMKCDLLTLPLEST